MQQGRPAKPLELKRKAGTLRADRLPSASVQVLTNSDTQPEPPEHLQEAAERLWGLLWGTHWISQTTDYQLVLMTCELLDEREQVRKALADNPEERQWRIALREIEKQLIGQLGLLGFSPSDRSRLGLAEVKTTSKLQQLIEAQRAADNRW